MSDRWIVLELSSLGEREDPERMGDLLRHLLEDKVEVFVPVQTYTRRDQKRHICYTEGYAFVKAGLSAGEYLQLEHSPYVERVLVSEEADGHYISYLDQSYIDGIRAHLAEMVLCDLEEGDQVEVLSGVYSGLTGEVLHIYADRPREDQEAEVRFVLRSLDTVAKLPLAFLHKK